jgi:hypothetical protein
LVSTLVIILNCISLFIGTSFISSMLFFYDLSFLEFNSFVLSVVFFLKKKVGDVLFSFPWFPHTCNDRYCFLFVCWSLYAEMILAMFLPFSLFCFNKICC